MKLTLLTLALALGVTIASVDNCQYWGKASQADDGIVGYEYCNADGTLTSTGQNSPAKLTATVEGTHGECRILEEDLTDQELIDQLGLYTRPNYKGTFTQSGDDLIFSLDQFGDSNCAFIQRHIEMVWGDDFCAPAQDPSQGVVHDMYFMDDSCGATWSQMSAIEKTSQARQDFIDIQDELFDPWRLITPIVNGTKGYQYNSNVSTVSFTQDEDFTPQDSLCYGLGDEFAAPYHIPVVYEEGNDTFVRNVLHAPYPFAFGDRTSDSASPGYLCGYDCSDDVDAAMAAYAVSALGGDPPELSAIKMAFAFANSSCGVGYGMMEGYNTTLNPLTMGISAETILQAMMFLDVGRPRMCGLCAPYAEDSPVFGPLNVIGRIGDAVESTFPGLPNAGSRYTYCQTDVVMASFLWMDPSHATFDATCNVDSTTDSTSALSVTFALLAAIAVALRN